MRKVYYKKLVEGLTVPAIIHNSGYHYIDMPVYEDGSIDCWKRLPLSELPNKLKCGWLVTGIPVNRSISIHGLGSYKIHEAKWEHTTESYTRYIHGCVKTMNNQMMGLFEETQEQKARQEERKVSWTTHATPFKLKGNYGYTMLDGASSSVFYKAVAGWQLTSVIAYADETLTIDAIPEQFFTLEKIRQLLASGQLDSGPKGVITILIPGLGTITGEAEYGIDSAEKLKEIVDMAASVSGKPGAHECCEKLYHEYLVRPCRETRNRLWEAYEAVPEHKRIYLGDMDIKDSDYQRILYSERKREV